MAPDDLEELFASHGLRVCGEVPKDLVWASRFDDINGDGRSTGAGRIERLELDVVTPTAGGDMADPGLSNNTAIGNPF